MRAFFCGRSIFLPLSLSLSVFLLILSFSNLEASGTDCANIFLPPSHPLEALLNKDPQAWIGAKASDFSLPYFSSGERLKHRYLNNILDTLINANTSFVQQKKKAKSKNIIIFVEETAVKMNVDADFGGYRSIGNGLIELVTNPFNIRFTPNYSDQHIAAVLSRELVHTIKSHPETMKVLKSMGTVSEDVLLEYERKFEIEADELGFDIYVNAGYPLEEYKKMFLIFMELDFYGQLNTYVNQYTSNYNIVGMWYRDPMPRRGKRNSFLLYNSKKCLFEGRRALANGELDSFMDLVKFEDKNKDPAPSNCWRYWNMYKKEREFLKSKPYIVGGSNISPLYLRLKLEELNPNETVDTAFDSVTQRLLENAPLNYSLVRLNSENKIELSPESNTVFIRANDIFREIMMVGIRRQGRDWEDILKYNYDFREIIGGEAHIDIQY